MEKDLLTVNSQIKNELIGGQQYRQTKYRWAIVAVTCMMLILNGLLNNIITPIQSKLAEVYDYSSKVVNASTIISFLTFLIANIPANYIIDTKGIKFGLNIGLGLWFIGICCACLINVGFPFVILGCAIFAAGQPFIVNTPAKIATYWFLPQNRALATSIVVGSSIIGAGFGFAVPTLVVSEESKGQEAKSQIFTLYLSYGLVVLTVLILNFFIIKSKPQIPTSNVVQKQNLSIKQTFKHIFKDKNEWKFVGSYALIYGSFQVFGTSSNFLLKPFNYTNIQISICAVSLIVCGTVGSIIFSIIVKKTGNYRKIVTIVSFGSVVGFALIFLQFLIVPMPFVTIILIGGLGFMMFPLLPLSYQIGCQLCFPIGEAAITGVLNGSSLVQAFLLDLILTAAIGFGSQVKTYIYFGILICMVALGAVLYRFTDFRFKRTKFELREEFEQNESPQNNFTETQITQQVNIDNYSTVSSDSKPQKYDIVTQQK